MLLAIRQMLFDPARSLLTVTAMAAVITAILILEGFHAGLLAQMRNAVINRQGDLIVTQAGVSNMIAANNKVLSTSFNAIGIV